MMKTALQQPLLAAPLQAQQHLNHAKVYQRTASSWSEDEQRAFILGLFLYGVYKGWPSKNIG